MNDSFINFHLEHYWSIPKRKIYQNNFIYTNKKSNNQDFYQVAFSKFIDLNFLYLGSSEKDLFKNLFLMIPCYYVLMVPISKREFYIYMANYTGLLELYPNLDSWETH